MRSLHARFLRFVKDGGRVLDAGCGSGRDAQAFATLGYDVLAIDASESMVEAAVARGVVAMQARFEELDFEYEFDGIWACASLLHVPPSQLGDVLRRLHRALRPGGALYVSFKFGEGWHERRGRWFHDLSLDQLKMVLEAAGLEVADAWTTRDVRPGKSQEAWANAIGRVLHPR